MKRLALLLLLLPLALAGCNAQRDTDIATSAAVIHSAAASLPASPQRAAIMANAEAIAKAAGHPLEAKP